LHKNRVITLQRATNSTEYCTDMKTRVIQRNIKEDDERKPKEYAIQATKFETFLRVRR